MGAALILDFDGVVIDSESTWLAAWREEYELYGLPFDISEWLDFIGKNTFDPRVQYEFLAKHVGPTFDVEACRVRKQDRERDLLLTQPVLPGVLTWLIAARRLGVPTAIASNSSRSWVVPHVERLDLTEFFDEVIGREDAERLKPAPDLYIEAAKRVGVATDRCVAVEDSAHGIAAARAAGCFCVAVPNPVTERHDLTAADLRLESLADIGMDEVLKKLDDNL